MRDGIGRLLALLLVICMLAGCAKNENTTITIIEPQQNTWTDDQTDYGQTGYYSPSDTTSVYTDAIIPAPGAVTDWTDTPVQDEVDSAAGSMEHGDITYGVVVGTDAVLHPLRTTYRDFYAINHLVFESLVELDENLQPVPLLADRWTVDGNVWTFTLRADVQFHNGADLVAQDVVESYNEIRRNPATLWYALTNHIEAIEAVDDLTLRVKSDGLGYLFLYCMTFPIVQRSSVDSAYPSGTGPYWYIRYDVSQALRIEANPLWWKHASGTFHSLVAICYKTTKAALVGLELGEIDALATDYPTASLNRNLSDRMTFDYSTQTYECIVPNLKNGILSDLSVRQALMYAIDRNTLGNTVYAGMVQESEVPVVPGSWLYETQAALYNYNPERARKLLVDAGWADTNDDGILEKEIDGKTRTLSLSLITADRGTTATRSEAVESIAYQLRRVGFDISVRVLDSSAEVQEALDNGKYDMALTAFELSAIPNLAFLLSSSGKSNYQRYSSDAMDSYLHETYSANDADTLAAAMSGVQMLVVEELPILGLFFRAGVMISMSSVGGLTGTRQLDVLRGLATAQPTT